MDAEGQNEILAKLDRVLRLLALQATREMRQRDQIAILSRAGFAPKEIAEILGTSANTVRVELVTIRRNKRKGSREGSPMEQRNG